MTARTGRAHKTRGDEMNNKNNEGLTPDEVRAAYVTDQKEIYIHSEEHMLELVDWLIGFLKDNREQIGGISLNVVAKHNEALYDAQENKATNGLSCQFGLGKTLTDTMDKNLQNLIDGVRCGEVKTELPEELASILNALKA
jgi:hypothetical protein